MLEWFIFGAIVSVGCVFIFALSYMSIFSDEKRKKKDVYLVAVVAMVVNIVITLSYYGDPGTSVLFRDFISRGILAGVITIVAEKYSSGLSKRGVSFKLKLLRYIIFFAVAAFMAPLFILFMHCTSGDCL
jgi:Co/Zn/Cd efflux system component